MHRQLRRLAAASAAGVMLAIFSAPEALAFEPRVPQSFFGTSAPELWDETVQNRDAARDAQLNGMKAAGIDWVRVEIGWPEVEPNAPVGGSHSYAWGAADRLVAALASRNMELMAMPAATPAWAASADATAASCGRRGEVATSRASDYAAFVAAIARRYGPTGTFWSSRPDLPRVPIKRWEIWNEPNWSGFWCPEPDPEIYATMLKRAADSIHAVDAGAQVIVGGFAALQDSEHQGERLRGMAADEFLVRALAREPSLVGAIDAVGFHPYDLDPEVDLSIVGWLRRKLDAASLGHAEIVLSEFGWRGGLGLGTITEVLRAQNYTDLTGRISRTDCGVSAVAAHSWQTKELDLFHPDHWWGISSPLTGLLHPSGRAYRDQIALYEGRGPTPAPREVIGVCGAVEPPDGDGDGTPDEDDDYPTDPDRDSGSGEEPPPPPEEEPEEPRPNAPRAHESFFGATIVQLPDDFIRLGDDFEAMASARIASARMRFDWSWIEPRGPGDPQYLQTARWDWLDRVILKMGSEGIRLTPSFGAIPTWVSPSGSAFDTQLAAFVARFADRYGEGGTFWTENRHLDEGQLAVRDFEVWQFGNMQAHAPDGVATPADYAATYAAVRAVVSSRDPNARAIASLGELGTGGTTAGGFLKSMVEARPALAGEIDAVHVWAEHSRTVTTIDGVLRSTRSGLERADNAGTPILLSFGAPTRGAGAQSESARAELFAQVASRAARGDCGVDGVFAHAWTTPESNPDNPYDWFGIADPDDSALSGTALAYRDVAAAFGGFGQASAPAAGVHPCDALPPDSDGDGTRDPADPAPWDPAISTPTQAPPPAPAIGGTPSSPTASRVATLSLSAPGAVSYQCSLDEASFAPCSGSPSFTNLAHGSHQVRARAVDSLGLVGPAATVSWAVDLVGPTITDVSGPIPVSLSSRVEFAFSSDDAGAQTMCQLDGHPWQPCSSPQVYGFIGDGTHDFRTKAVDGVGNVGPVRLTQFAVRTDPGAASIDSGPEEGGLSGPVPEFRHSASFAASFDCRFDSESWGPCSGGASHVPETPLAEGPHTFEVRSVGGTGKLGTAASRNFVVDGSPPAIDVRVLRIRGSVARFALEAEDPSGPPEMQCLMDSRKPKPCGSRYSANKLREGRHTLTVRATDRVGNASELRTRFRIPAR